MRRKVHANVRNIILKHVFINYEIFCVYYNTEIDRHMTLLHAFTRIVSEKTFHIYATAVAFRPTTCVPPVLRTYKLKVEQTVFRHE